MEYHEMIDRLADLPVSHLLEQACELSPSDPPAHDLAWAYVAKRLNARAQVILDYLNDRECQRQEHDNGSAKR